MTSKFWGVIVFLLIATFAATPASGRDVYVASANMNGDATYMALNPDGTFSDQEDLQLSSLNHITGYSFGNGIGDFNGDGELDYIMALGRFGGDIYVFPKSGPGNQFGDPVLVGNWTQGVYPADMAVADFNGDGHLDFVLNYFYSTHCGLYLGNGALEFEFILLENTTPMPAMGIDAADFNNDEYIDFIVAPNTSGPFHVYLGNGDGTFEQVIADRGASATMAFGIAAGNFVADPDGFADLAVSSPTKLEIFTGNGDGTFALYKTYDMPMNPSALDNGDFNGDGHQDLVAADYGMDHSGVAVLHGDGSGQFSYQKTYLGGSAGYRKAVTALPFTLNKPPVALLTPETITVTVGETVEWDASESYDEDGIIVNYKWDFGDGVVDTMGIDQMAMADSGDDPEAVQTSYVYFDSGTYLVTLTVTDDQGATSVVQAEVKVEPLQVGVWFSPRRLNLKSKGKWITATIRLPRGYDACKVVADSIFLVPEGHAEIQAQKVYGHRYCKKYHKRHKNYKKKHWRRSKLRVKFDRQELIGVLADSSGKMTLTVMGEIATENANLEFEGSRTVKVYEKKKKRFSKKDFWQHLWRLLSKGGSKHR